MSVVDVISSQRVKTINGVKVLAWLSRSETPLINNTYKTLLASKSRCVQ